MKRCAVCGSEYDAAYDSCPACARGRERSKSIIAGAVTVAILALLACGASGAFSAFMQGLTG